MAFWRRLMSWFGDPRQPAGEQPAREEPTPEPRDDEPAPVEARRQQRAPRPPAILGATYAHHGGGIAGATPTADVWIQGVPCRARAAVAFHRNGQLASATLARAHEVDGEALAAETLVIFATDGRLSGWMATLATDRVFHVPDAKATAVPMAVPAGSRVMIEHGKLREAELASPLVFDALAFPAATTLLFGDSGALSHVTCGKPLELRGIRWAAYEAVVFEFGHLREGWPVDDGTLDDIPYAGGEPVQLHDNGTLASCHLAADTTLSGVRCRAGTEIARDERGRLVEGTLAADAVLAGVPVAADSVVVLDAGAPIALTPREDCELDGVPCARGALIELTGAGRLVRATLARPFARDGWQLPAGSVVVLDAGRLRLAIVTDAQTPDGRALDGTWRVDLGADGAIRHLLPVHGAPVAGPLTLRATATVAGLTASAGSNVELADDGTLRSLVLATDQRVGPAIARAGTRVHLGADGTPSNLYLAAATRIDGVPCAAAQTLAAVMNDVEHTYGEEVRLHGNGTLAFATLAEDATVAGVPLAARHTIARYPNGALHVGTLAQRWTHPLGCVARARTLLGLFEDGSPSLVTLAEPFTIAGVEHPAGAVLSFSAPGELATVDREHVPLGPCEPVT